MTQIIFPSLPCGYTYPPSIPSYPHPTPCTLGIPLLVTLLIIGRPTSELAIATPPLAAHMRSHHPRPPTHEVAPLECSTDLVDIIDEARRALSEGREPPLPLLTIPREMANHPEVREIQHQFGLTPSPTSKSSSAVPAHLRTSSTQVEPSTPPKWMTFAEAEEKVREANRVWSNPSKTGPRGYGDERGSARSGGGLDEKQAERVSDQEVVFKKNKKERPTGMSPSHSPSPTVIPPHSSPLLSSSHPLSIMFLVLCLLFATLCLLLLPSFVSSWPNMICRSLSDEASWLTT